MEVAESSVLKPKEKDNPRDGKKYLQLIYI